MGAAVVKIHAAFLIHEGLQQFEFSFGNLDLDARCGHRSPLVFSGFEINQAEAAADWFS